jgi:hypothetical protein
MARGAWGRGKQDGNAEGIERTERMLELIPANKTEHPRFAIRGVRVKDWEPRIRIASPDESGELVAQGAHRVRVPNVDHLYVAISLAERKREGWGAQVR